MNFFDVCKLVKSTEEFNIEFIADNSGNQFYYSGFIITYKVNDLEIEIPYDLFCLFDGNANNWEEAKEIMLNFENINIVLNEMIHNCNGWNIEIDEDTSKQNKEKWIKCMNYIVTQIESIAEANQFDLDSVFIEEEDEDDYDDYDDNE